MTFLDSDSQDHHRPYLAHVHWGGLGQERSLLAVLSTVHTADGSGIGRQCGFDPWLKTLIVEGMQSSLLRALLAPREEHIQHKSHCALWGPSMGLHRVLTASPCPDAITNQETFYHKPQCPATEAAFIGFPRNKVNHRANSHTAKRVLLNLTYRYCLGMGLLNQKYKHFHDFHYFTFLKDFPNSRCSHCRGGYQHCRTSI